MEVKGLSRWKKNSAYQISAKRLFNLRRQAARHIIVQPTKSTPQQYLFCRRICYNPWRYITLPSLPLTLSQERQRSEQTAKQERKKLQSKQTDTKAEQKTKRGNAHIHPSYYLQQTRLLLSPQAHGKDIIQAAGPKFKFKFNVRLTDVGLHNHPIPLISTTYPCRAEGGVGHEAG